MMFPLAAHAHLVVVDEDVVLLDVAADRYLCVPGGRDLLRPAQNRAAVSPSHPEVVAALRDAGLLATACVAGRRLPPRPSRDLPGDEASAFSLRDAGRLLAALCDVLWAYRGRPLRKVVAFAARASPAAPQGAADVMRLAGLYRQAVVWLPLPRKCLIRSFVLLRFLQRSGLGAQWVFGVRTWPFSAHCWLQLGDLALDDSAERLVAYEPIFAVG